MKRSIDVQGIIRLLLLIGLVVFFVTIAPRADKGPAYIVHGDNIIFPEKIEGLSIQNYATARVEKQQWFYVLKIHGPGQQISFETREEAEDFMLYLAMEAGI